jgi:hypothetical protein
MLSQDWDEIKFSSRPRRPKKNKTREISKHISISIIEFLIRNNGKWITPTWVAYCLNINIITVLIILNDLEQKCFLSAPELVPFNQEVMLNRHIAWSQDNKWYIGYRMILKKQILHQQMVHSRCLRKYENMKYDTHDTNIRYCKPIISDLMMLKHYKGRVKKLKRETGQLAKKIELIPAPWNGMARRVLTNTKIFHNTCIDTGIEPYSVIPWYCSKCCHVHCRNEHDGVVCLNCQCKEQYPILISTLKKPHLCNLCEKSTRRHADRHTIHSKNCFRNMIKLVHNS